MLEVALVTSVASTGRPKSTFTLNGIERAVGVTYGRRLFALGFGFAFRFRLGLDLRGYMFMSILAVSVGARANLVMLVASTRGATLWGF